MAAKEAIEDKVKQALMLKDSTAYDPDLSHKTKCLNEGTDWPNSSLLLSSLDSSPQQWSSEVNQKNNKPFMSPIGWPPSGQLFQNRAESPQIYTSFNNFSSHQMSPSFLGSNINSFIF